MVFIPLAEPWIGPDCAQAVGKQVASGFLGPGEATSSFARRLATLTGTAHCTPTTSGTIALTVAAKALDLKPGDEIIVPAYGVISTINAFASFGYVPRLVDIDPATACIDPAALAARMTARTKAVCFVNFSGHTGAPLAEVAAFCRKQGTAANRGRRVRTWARHDGKSAGSFGTVGCLSFSVPKIVTTGQGGAVVTDDKAVADRAPASSITAISSGGAPISIAASARICALTTYSLRWAWHSSIRSRIGWRAKGEAIMLCVRSSTDICTPFRETKRRCITSSSATIRPRSSANCARRRSALPFNIGFSPSTRPMRGLTTAIFSARAAGGAAPSICRSASPCRRTMSAGSARP